MKRNLALLLASMLLVFALTACGKDDKNITDNDGQTAADGTNASNSDTSNNSVTDHGIGNNNDDNNANRGEDPITGTDDSGNQDSVVKQNNRSGNTTYGHMLRNAKTHTSDGLLKDLENAVTPGSVR